MIKQMNAYMFIYEYPMLRQDFQFFEVCSSHPIAMKLEDVLKEDLQIIYAENSGCASKTAEKTKFHKN